MAAGDDVVSHDRVVEVEADMTVGRFVADILASGYLPSIWGGEATWVVRAGRRGRALGVVAQQWSAPSLFVPESSAVAEAGEELHFEYRTQEDPAVVVGELSRTAGRE